MLFILKGRLLVLRETENNTKFYANLPERKLGNVKIINLHARTTFASNGKLAPQKIPHIEDQLISDGSLILGDNGSPGYQTIIIYFINI